MSNTDQKMNITFCPFQTHIPPTGPKPTHEQLILGVSAIPLIKVQCDREKCQLWIPAYNVCAVSHAASQLSRLDAGIDRLCDEVATVSDLFKDKTTQPACAEKS